MDDAQIRETLIKCFSTVFPELTRAEIESASTANTNGWDSIAHVTLLTLVGEEFGVEIDFERFEGAPSFAEFLTVIEETVGQRR